MEGRVGEEERNLDNGRITTGILYFVEYYNYGWNEMYEIIEKLLLQNKAM